MEGGYGGGKGVGGGAEGEEFVGLVFELGLQARDLLFEAGDIVGGGML